MTLIASFDYKNNDSIFMLGDGLISTEDKPDGNFIMPGVGKVGRPQSRQGYFFHSLEQKLNVIDSRLAFLWSGRRDLAAKFGSDLYLTYKKNTSSFGMLKKFLDSYPLTLSDNEKNEIKLICVIRYKKKYKVWQFGTTEFKGYKHFSSLWISGTGRNNFLDTIADEYDKIDSDSKALGHAMNVLNKFYFDDMFTKDNYSEAFGGFYEIANCSQSGIAKVNDTFITSIHVYTDKLEEGFAVPLTFLKYDAINDLTVIREVRASSMKNGNPKLENFGHAYLPIVEEMREKAFKQSELLHAEGSCFNSRYIGDLRATHTIIMLNIEDSKNSLKIPLYFRKSKRDGPVTLSLVDGQTEVFFSQELLDIVNRNIDEFVDKKTLSLKTS